MIDFERRARCDDRCQKELIFDRATGTLVHRLVHDPDAHEGVAKLLVAGGLTIDISRQKLTRDGQSIKATWEDWAILRVLASEPGRVVSLNNLVRLARPEEAHRLESDQSGVRHMVHMQVNRMRQRIGPAVVETVVGIGFRLAIEEGV